MIHFADFQYIFFFEKALLILLYTIEIIEASYFIFTSR